MKRYGEQGVGKGCGAFMHLECSIIPKLPRVHQPRSSPNPHLSATLLKSGRGYHRCASGMLELTPTGSESWLYALLPTSAFNVLVLVAWNWPSWGIYTMTIGKCWKSGCIFREPVVRHWSVHYWLGFRSQVTQRKVPENINTTNELLKQLRAENGRKRSTCPLLNRTMPGDKLDEGKEVFYRYVRARPLWYKGRI